PLELAPGDHIAFGINAMDLENRLCDVETDCRNRLHGPVLRIGSPHGDHGTYVPVEEPSTASQPDSCTAAIHFAYSITYVARASSIGWDIEAERHHATRVREGSSWQRRGM